MKLADLQEGAHLQPSLSSPNEQGVWHHRAFTRHPKASQEGAT